MGSLLLLQSARRRVMKAVFWFALWFNGEPHQTLFEGPPEPLAMCLFEVHEFLSKPPHQLIIRGGELRAGCTLAFPKSEEH